MAAGFGYSFFNKELLKEGQDEFSGNFKDLSHHLLFEPGTKWAYGVVPSSVPC